jgi:nitrogenase molybdenum-cofactor synthesis protein NifE
MVREEVGGDPARPAALQEGLQGKRAAVYVGGAFKAFSLVRALRTWG